jgi:transcriptional antiterminator NusG
MENYWYVMKVLSGKEKALSEQLNQQITLGKINNVLRFLCPIEKEYIQVKDKKVLRDKIIYNGYVYFESKNKLKEDELKDFSNFPHVISMFGEKMPLLMSKMDVQRILKDELLNEHNETKRIKYSIGEIILIKDGAFGNFEGSISSINDDKVDVDVMIFGRKTPVTLNIEQISKVE